MRKMDKKPLDAEDGAIINEARRCNGRSNLYKLSERRWGCDGVSSLGALAFARIQGILRR